MIVMMPTFVLTDESKKRLEGNETIRTEKTA
jgi:hypothetical protein